MDTMKKQEKKEFYNAFNVFQHNILKIREVYMTNGGKGFHHHEYAEKGTLREFIYSQKGKQLPENQILDWNTQIFLAVKHFHDQNFLASHNLFITKNNCIKLGDFSTGKVLSHRQDKIKTQIQHLTIYLQKQYKKFLVPSQLIYGVQELTYMSCACQNTLFKLKNQMFKRV
ncbi:unnamed protein product [Paramecium sonneborni]|uniref:non-specific serine/threonine protein kinase n=1 Tax=Paramecium sonneborni TaxID=65129 RepID=A0A8S1PM53_9CILI|nr:unnamed protein product [Paramecium sonneborni]